MCRSGVEGEGEVEASTSRTRGSPRESGTRLIFDLSDCSVSLLSLTTAGSLSYLYYADPIDLVNLAPITYSPNPPESMYPVQFPLHE